MGGKVQISTDQCKIMDKQISILQLRVGYQIFHLVFATKQRIVCPVFDSAFAIGFYNSHMNGICCPIETHLDCFLLLRTLRFLP